MAEPSKILVTGALGQIGSELTPALRERFGIANVVAGVHRTTRPELPADGPSVAVDVTDRQSVERAVSALGIDTVYHLAGVLSAAGERDPERAWDVNVNGLRNVLEVARERKLRRVFVPSSIAVFGQGCPRDLTPQDTVLQPGTIYGITKVAGELLGEYYVRRHGVDMRGLRLPGIISHETPPGGGTTDYAVEIFYEAVKTGVYTCFLNADTALPMMYMPDCINAIIGLMSADAGRLTHHTGFNVTGFSVTPAQLAAEVTKHLPGFTIRYQPDFRQAIADSWPRSLDDSAARTEWGWRPQYDAAAVAADMLAVLRQRFGGGAG